MINVCGSLELRCKVEEHDLAVVPYLHPLVNTFTVGRGEDGEDTPSLKTPACAWLVVVLVSWSAVSVGWS